LRSVTLREYRTTSVPELTRDEVMAIARIVPDLRVAPSPTVPNAFDVTPGSWIGAVCLPGVEIQILPKIELSRLLFLVSYAVDPASWRNSIQGFSHAESVCEAIAPAFVRMVAAATKRGLLHGYRTAEDSLLTVRGQIRFGDQLRRHLGLAPPIEVQFDEFSADIPENQLLKAALRALSRMRLRSGAVARALHGGWVAFEQVAEVEFDSRRVPEPTFTRLNRHYEPAVALARLILKGCSFDLGTGRPPGTSFLLDMNEVFEAFLYRALLESLGVPATVFRRGSGGLTLDEATRVRLAPDLSWWHGNNCVFVGDAKYKRLDGAGFKHADLYQLLAYATAANLDHGLLVYASGEADPAAHKVRFAGIELLVASLDLSGEPAQILDEVGRIADGVRSKAISNVLWSCPQIPI
jgi:5-methylcytosine-specific restriction enzyme subunit McrC